MKSPFALAVVDKIVRALLSFSWAVTVPLGIVFPVKVVMPSLISGKTVAALIEAIAAASSSAFICSGEI